MKILVILLAMISLSYAAHIDDFALKMGYERDYAGALERAKKEKKMVMLLLVGDYCPWCKKFERKTMAKQEVDTVIKENFIPLIVDKYKEKGKYPAIFYSPVIPAVYFINPKTQESVYECAAYMKKDEFLENIDDALMSYTGE